MGLTVNNNFCFCVCCFACRWSLYECWWPCVSWLAWLSALLSNRRRMRMKTRWRLRRHTPTNGPCILKAAMPSPTLSLHATDSPIWAQYVHVYLSFFFISSLSSIFLSIFTVHLVFNSSHKTNVDVILPSSYAHFSCFCTPPTRSVTRTHQRKGLLFFPLPPTDAVKVSPDPNSERNTNFIYL